MGSSTEVMFGSAYALQDARLLVKAMRQEFIPGRPAWLDAKRVPAEAAPVRVIHRLHEALLDAQRRPGRPPGRAAGTSAASEITKDIASRSIRVGGVRIAYVSQLRVKWTPQAAEHFGSEQREAASAYAQAM